MITNQPFFERVHEVTEFCLANAGKCFGGWPRETVFLYVGFHALAGTIFVVRRDGHLAAVGFAWPCQPDRATADFNWHPVAPGDAIMVREVIGTREACRAMFRQALARWPNVKRFFAYRMRDNRHELKEFTPAAMERFCHE